MSGRLGRDGACPVGHSYVGSDGVAHAMCEFGEDHSRRVLLRAGMVR